MVLTKEVELPQYTELNSREVNVSMATLMSAAPYLGKVCENVNNEFMLCRQETNDPRPCIELGKRVTECAIQVFQRIKKECLEEFKQYANCIDKSSGDFSYTYCRKTQCAFDDCMATKCCLYRPEFGYFCRARVHSSTSSAPQPPPCPCHPPVTDPTPSLPDCKLRTSPRFGGRNHWITE
ncbi:NADH dehydrogenase [ubiquinone] 1 alpha subcomplex subunit 8-like [Ostrinia furnacalis]|uniref:NADH dehydrogenase [ubiquinone] 1 alpha subcomplex subunit 8-like n=1 Tax=Ostrinia furnacalis TaxID=93504 RepID=UPI00103B2226|nr:NADH dehydrogenase [ubiquinone] 1 alpha subcomplex subunit 8-like [Ostrinia furnacalis]